MSKVQVKTTTFTQIKSAKQLMDEYQFPEEIKNLKLKHGEPLMNMDLIYETVMQGTNPETFESLKIAKDTSYRQDVYFNMPANRKLLSVGEELDMIHTESKPLKGPICSKCGSNNTTVMTNQERSCDEGYTVYLICYNCKLQVRNPRNLVYSKKK